MRRLKSKAFNTPDVYQSVTSSETMAWGPTAAPFTLTYLQKRKQGFYEGVSTLGYYGLRSRGYVVPPTQYLRWDSEFSQAGNCRLMWRFNDGNVRTATGPFSDYWEMFGKPISFMCTPEEASKAMTDARIDASALVREAAGEVWDGFDAGTFLAEVLKTVRLIANIRQSIVNYARLTVPRKYDRIDRLDHLSTAWLEWKFGWDLLIKDLASASESLNAYDLGNGIRSEVKRAKKITESSYDVTCAQRLNGEDLTLAVTTHTEVSCVGRVVAKTPRFGSPFFNVAITAYEVIPLSWVLDYFYDLGSWVKALAAGFDSDSLSGSIGYQVTITKTGVVKRTSCSPGNALFVYDAKGGFKSSIVYRTRAPASAYSLPNLGFADTLFELANMAALIGSRTHRLFKTRSNTNASTFARPH